MNQALPSSDGVIWQFDTSRRRRRRDQNKIAALIHVVLMLLPLIYPVLKFHSSTAQYLKDALFLALYLTSVFVLFDFLYLAIAQDHGLRYLADFWSVTVLYVIFWTEIPLVGRLMQKEI